MKCLWMLTPAEAQETLANESWPHFANDSQVGLPRLCQHPAERRQEEEVQEGSSHSTETLKGGEKSVMVKQAFYKRQKGRFRERCRNESSLRHRQQRKLKLMQKHLLGQKSKWDSSTLITTTCTVASLAQRISAVCQKRQLLPINRV